MRCCALSTFDNPYDPFDQKDNWLIYDMLHGYDSSGLLARIARVSDFFTTEENNSEIERAIDRIVALDFTNTFKKVVKEIDDEDEYVNSQKEKAS